MSLTFHSYEKICLGINWNYKKPHLVPRCTFLKLTFDLELNKHSNSPRRPDLSLITNCLIVSLGELGGFLKYIHSGNTSLEWLATFMWWTGSLAEIRERKKLLTNHNTGHMTQKENYTVTSHCSLGGFCPSLEIGFALSQSAAQSRRWGNGSVEKTHHLMHMKPNVYWVIIYSLQVTKDVYNSHPTDLCQSCLSVSNITFSADDVRPNWLTVTQG